MDLQLADQVAVIVGGAEGIGAAIAAEFAAEGARVVVMDIHPKVEELAARLTANHHHAALGMVTDATDYAAMQAASERIQKELGRCDHLVYAAGAGSGKYGFPFWNLEPRDWENVLRVNLLGAVNTAHAFATRLIEAHAGTMLFLASVAGQIGSQTDPPYSAAKAGLINFAQCAAKDLAPYGVRVNALCPGMVETALGRRVWEAWRQTQPPEKQLTWEAWSQEKIENIVPLRRWQTPEDLAAMAVFLASPRGSNITGQTLNVDGGFVMHC